ncbi:DDB1- and CUL4-associated factor 17-like [Daphnia carinata]|uniref:DDB1- and CUL4-associated factor 17-like n=1 Tax=Daphnia carinata TaxID=120202 RepID=UPI00257DA257|nr:DDB1- and CUL4-associated factor 17-like [Daphnia carinata]
MARVNNNANFSPLNLMQFREYSISTQNSKHLNWKILRSFLTCNEGFTLKEIQTFQGAKSCCRIIYSDGYLIIKEVSTSNTLKVYNLNGHNRTPFLKSTICDNEEWKDRSFGIAPILNLSSQITQNHGFKTGLYYITATKLHVLNFYDGTVEAVTLPVNYRFSGIAIDDETHTLAVSSVKNLKGNLLMVFALYEYYPCLAFQQLLQIQKSIFGLSITGAEINQGLLLTLHQSNKVKVYSLATVCQQQGSSLPPVLYEIETINHVMLIGTTPYHIIKATRVNSFFIQNLEDGRALGIVEAKPDSFDPYLGFHPDASTRLIFTDNGTLRLFDIVTKDGMPTLVPGHLHSRTVGSEANASGERLTTTTTRSGRTIRKPTNSSSCSQTDDDEEAVQIIWDYEDDLNLLAILYAFQVNERNAYFKLTLDLVDSLSGKRLRRIELDQKIRTSPYDTPELFLRLDADQCLISISRNSRTSILVFRFISTSK